MSQHEANKARNRQRILAAAEQILLTQGPEALSMRGLAEQAGVSLRTPYNLFGSKTAVLGALLMNTLERFAQPLATQPDAAGLGRLFGLLDRLRQAEALFNPTLRQLFWSLMTAPEQMLREEGIARSLAAVQPWIDEAQRLKQLPMAPGAEVLTRQLVMPLLALLGMWAGGQLGIAAVLQHTEQLWCSSLLPYVGAPWDDDLRARLQACSRAAPPAA